MAILLNRLIFPIGQCGEASRWRVCYQRGLPLLVNSQKPHDKCTLYPIPKIYSIRCKMFFVHCSLPSPSREVCAVANYPALANWGILIIQLARNAGCIAPFFTELAPSLIQSIGCYVYRYFCLFVPLDYNFCEGIICAVLKF